jgi:hypothetical protein
MAYVRSQRQRSLLTVDPSPMVESRWDSLSWSQKQQLLGLSQNFWSPIAPVSPAQQAINQANAVVDFLPFYINDGGSRRDATVGRFYK